MFLTAVTIRTPDVTPPSHEYGDELQCLLVNSDRRPVGEGVECLALFPGHAGTVGALLRTNNFAPLTYTYIHLFKSGNLAHRHDRENKRNA